MILFVRVHHLPKQRFFANDFDVVLDVDEVRNAVKQTCEISNSTRAFELRRSDKFFLNRDQVDGARSFDQLNHLPENHAMRIQVEVFGPESLQNPVVIFVVNEYCAENGFFGVYVVREVFVRVIDAT